MKLTEAGSQGAASVTAGTHPVRRPQADHVFAINVLQQHRAISRWGCPAAWAAGGWLIVNGLILASLLGSTAQAISRENSLPRVLPNPRATQDARDFDALYRLAAQRLARLRAWSTLQRQQLPLGGTLAALATTLPARTWITGVTVDRDARTLTVRARYLVDPARPDSLPASAWIAALKADPRFGERLTRLAPGESSRATQGRAQVVDFELLGEWGI